MQVVLCSYVGWFVGGKKGHIFASKASKRRIGPQIKYPLKKNGSYFLSNFSLKVMTPMTPFIRLAIWIGLATVYYVQVILFEIDCTIFYTNLHEFFCQFISWTNWVNSGKSMDICWISSIVIADIINLYL